jgi:NhaP-type Na+/H+ or K+/H+ antiporter
VDWALAVLALTLLAFAAISRRLEGTPVTAPMVFTAAGLLFGVDALGLVDPAATGESVKVLAEATLTLVLFSDASRIDLKALRGEISVPARLLGIGLPLTLVLGFALGLVVFGSLSWPEVLVMAVILTPTDAALGQAVVTLPRLPSPVRQGLNVESGLNDGICVPIFLVALAVAQAEDGAIGHGAAIDLVLKEIGYGILAGVVAGAAAVVIVSFAGRRGLVERSWLEIVPLAGAALAFGIADPLGGSGFIAAFVGGAVYGGLARQRVSNVDHLIEQAGTVLSAATFLVFGAVLLEPAVADVTWSIVLYTVLSLTIVRMLPVAVAMRGTGARPQTVGFLGWFGPRGLASIVFALIVVEEGGLPHDGVLLATVWATVGLSVLAHGLTAAPFARRYARWFESQSQEDLSQLELS